MGCCQAVILNTPTSQHLLLIGQIKKDVEDRQHRLIPPIPDESTTSHIREAFSLRYDNKKTIYLAGACLFEQGT